MPTYEFINTETKEYFEQFMGFDEKDKFLAENPHIHQTITQAPGIISGAMGAGSSRVPDGFKEVLSKVAEAHPGTEFADKHGKLGIKEAKTRQVVKKHVEKITKRIEGGS